MISLESAVPAFPQVGLIFISGAGLMIEFIEPVIDLYQDFNHFNNYG